MKKKKGILERVVNQVIKVVLMCLLVFFGILFSLRAEIGFNISVKQKPYMPSDKPFIQSMFKIAKGVKTGIDTYKKF